MPKFTCSNYVSSLCDFALMSTCVVFCIVARKLVLLSADCIHVISCAVWHAACVFIGCVLSCCHVLCEHMSYEFSH